VDKKERRWVMKNFTPLHLHSEYSFRDSPAKITDIVNKCVSNEFTACAITEHGNMHSSLPFYKACNNSWYLIANNLAAKFNFDKITLKEIRGIVPNGMSLKEAVETFDKLYIYRNDNKEFFEELLQREIKPLLGVEAYILPTEDMMKSADKNIREMRYHMTLLAKNNEGYKSLMKAVSESYLYQHKTSQSTFARMTYKILERYFSDGNIVALSGCIHGEIAMLLAKNNYSEALEKAHYFKGIFGNSNFFLEIQNHGMEVQKLIKPDLVRLSHETNIKLVSTNDSHYIERGQGNVRDMIVAMRLNKKVTDDNYDPDSGELYIKSLSEMEALFPDILDSVYRTTEIADMCNVSIKKEELAPKYKTQNGETEKEVLSNMVKKGLFKRFPDFRQWRQERKDLFIKRIQHEIAVITKLQYEGYLLIVQDFIAKGREAGLVGPGRGSAVGSLVCFLLGITDVNPLQYGLLFERFLNPDRVSPPDIDTDFDTEIRDSVIEYVKAIYGEGSVCNIVTFGTLAARAAIRQAGRVTGEPYELCDRIAKLVPEQPGITLEEAYQSSSELQKACKEQLETQRLFDNAKKIEGLIVQYGKHAAGVIIANTAISNHIPLMYDTNSSSWITQYDKDVCENDVGLMKMDFLGLENLTIIKRAIQNIKKIYGKKIDIREIPLDDKTVIREIFAKGKTKATFQFESQGMISLLKRFVPQSLEDLILLNAAYRPGPLQYLDEIIEVKHKKKAPTYITPQLENILGVTYGKPIYQEQIMRIFNEIGGFTLSEADIIRRAMSKKKMSELEQYLPVFEQKLTQLGANQQAAANFSTELIEFANYAFNKSHSAAYSVLAYQTAWLKYYYPVEYMASVLASVNAEKLPLYIKECKDMGIKVLPPSINESDRYFTPKTDRKIRFGLEGVKHTGKSWEAILLEKEKNGEFRSFQDFLIRISASSVNKTAIESLIQSGAFDEFRLNRKQMSEGLEEYVKAIKTLRKKSDEKSDDKNKQIRMFIGNDATIGFQEDKPLTPSEMEKQLAGRHFNNIIAEYDQIDLLEREKKHIGFYVSGHPLDKYKDILKTAGITLVEIDASFIGKAIEVAGQIQNIKKLQKKTDGATMCKFILEDMTGQMEVICFTKPYQTFSPLIKEGVIIKLKARVIKDSINDEGHLQLSLQEASQLMKADAS